MRCTLTLAVLLALALHDVGHAQSESTFVISRIPAGSVVRVWSTEPAMRRQLGTVDRSNGDSLRLRMDDALVSVPFVGVERLDTQVPRTPGEGARRGLARGLVAAVTLYALTLAAVGDASEAPSGLGVLVVTVGSTIVIGSTLVGAAKPGVRWTTVYER